MGRFVYGGSYLFHVSERTPWYLTHIIYMMGVCHVDGGWLGEHGGMLG
jgi:hypothetical protein